MATHRIKDNFQLIKQVDMNIYQGCKMNEWVHFHGNPKINTSQNTKYNILWLPEISSIVYSKELFGV